MLVMGINFEPSKSARTWLTLERSMIDYPFLLGSILVSNRWFCEYVQVVNHLRSTSKFAFGSLNNWLSQPLILSSLKIINIKSPTINRLFSRFGCFKLESRS